jgi:hypothetical protein
MVHLARLAGKKTSHTAAEGRKRDEGPLTSSSKPPCSWRTCGVRQGEEETKPKKKDGRRGQPAWPRGSFGALVPHEIVLAQTVEAGREVVLAQRPRRRSGRGSRRGHILLDAAGPLGLVLQHCAQPTLKRTFTSTSYLRITCLEQGAALLRLLSCGLVHARKLCKGAVRRGDTRQAAQIPNAEPRSFLKSTRHSAGVIVKSCTATTSSRLSALMRHLSLFCSTRSFSSSPKISATTSINSSIPLAEEKA